MVNRPHFLVAFPLKSPNTIFFDLLPAFHLLHPVVHFAYRKGLFFWGGEGTFYRKGSFLLWPVMPVNIEPYPVRNVSCIVLIIS